MSLQVCNGMNANTAKMQYPNKSHIYIYSKTSLRGLIMEPTLVDVVDLVSKSNFTTVLHLGPKFIKSIQAVINLRRWSVKEILLFVEISKTETI